MDHLTKMASGSKVLKKQFALMRAVWPRTESIDVLWEREASFLTTNGTGNVASFCERARGILLNSLEFQAYLRLVGAEQTVIDSLSENDAEWAGSFMTILKYQRLCRAVVVRSELQTAGTRIERRAGNPFRSPDTESRMEKRLQAEAEDETIVHVALVLLLEAVTRLGNPRNVEWTMSHISLHAYFARANYTAVTDGALREVIERKILACIEVKKRARDSNPDRVLMQETAQVVCLLKSDNHMDGPFDGRHLVVSQNGDRIYLTIIEFEISYKSYLQGQTDESERLPFLICKCYGPWKTFKKDHMEMFCNLILAIVMYINNRG